MAYVTSVEPDNHEVRSLHPTQVVCKVIVAECDGTHLVQLNTYGSNDRQVPGKLSQTLQFDETSGRQLRDILIREFGSD